MSKRHASKLDKFEKEIIEWFGNEHASIHEVQRRLAARGMKVSVGRLSGYWQQRLQDRMRSQLFERIATGSDLQRQIDDRFGKNPAPELDILIKLLRVIVMNLSVESERDPDLLKLIPNLMKPVLESVKLEQRERDLKLAEQKYQRDTCELFVKWAADRRATDIAGSTVSHTEKIEQLGRLMFGPEFRVAG